MRVGLGLIGRYRRGKWRVKKEEEKKRELGFWDIKQYSSISVNKGNILKKLVGTKKKRKKFPTFTKIKHNIYK